MKDKKLVVLYLAMLIVGVALLFTKSTTPAVVDRPPEPKVIVEQPPVEKKPQTEVITIAVAKRNIDKKTILTKEDYYFKSIEIAINEGEAKYITKGEEIDAYVAKNNIAKDAIIEKSFIASPNSEDYILLALKEGNYMFPFKLGWMDAYLIKNLKGGDLVDLYLFYGDESKNSVKLTSPSREFVQNRLKPIIVGKKLLYFDLVEDTEKKNDLAQVQLELSNNEIKLLRTLMTNSTIIMYPSTYKKSVEDGLRLLSDKERGWPLTEKDVLSGAKINMLKGK